MTIIETLVNADDGLRMSDVARRSNLPKSTVARALADLVRLGMAARVRDRYLLGPRTLACAAHVEPAHVFDRQSFILPSLLKLREETGLASAFSTLRYGQVHFESVLYVSRRIDTPSTAAPWTPAHCTSSGKVLLAYSPRVAHRVLESMALTAFTPHTITDPSELEAELAKIRRDGIAHSDREYIPDVSSAAVPIVDVHRGFVGAVAVCGTSGEISRAVVGSALRHAAWASTSAMRRQASNGFHH